MELNKQIAVDRVEVDGLGCISVRTATKVYEGEVLVAQSFHRHVIAPGQDYSQEADQVKAVCAATHTQEAIDAYKAATAPKEI